MYNEKAVIITPSILDRFKILLGMNIKVIVKVNMPYFKIHKEKNIEVYSCLTNVTESKPIILTSKNKI